MGVRKRKSAEARKERNKNVAVAKLNKYPSSARKMRLVADLVRGMEIIPALNALKFNAKDASIPMEKLLMSAINNWEQKNEGADAYDANLYIKEVSVDGGRMLKRIQPAPQGRAHRVRKRSSHVTLILDSKK